MILVTFLQYDCGPKHGSIFIIHVVDDDKEYYYIDISHNTTTLIPYGLLLKTEFLISVSSAWQQQSAALLFLLRLALGYTFWNLFGLEK